jgi:DNA-directed RNA polymerase subunit RPC12/RpoP
MKILLLDSFDNYIEAHLIMGRLKDDGINCWLQDENTITIIPILSPSAGEIKLMVTEDDFAKAKALLDQFAEEKKTWYSCPYCGSRNIEYITNTRKTSGWISAAVTWMLGSYAKAANKTWHCFDCKKDFDMPAFQQPGEKQPGA